MIQLEEGGLDQLSIESISQYLVFWIETDLSADYEADKIVFDFSCFNKLKQDFGEISKIKTLGFFGCSEEIERTLSEAYKIPFRIEREKIESKNNRGKIIMLTASPFLFVLMPLPSEMLLERPFNDKLIELTLFRYLQDICQRVIICPSQQCLASWYTEKQIDDIRHPFMKCHGSLKQYEFIQKDISEIQALDKKLEGAGEFIKDHDFTLVNEPNDSQYLLLVENISITKWQIYDGFKQIENILGTLFAKEFKGEFISKASLEAECKLKILKNNHKIIELLSNAKESIQYNFTDLRQTILNSCLNIVKSTYQKLKEKVYAQEKSKDKIFAQGFLNYSFKKLQFSTISSKLFLHTHITERELEEAVYKLHPKKKIKSVKKYIDNNREKFIQLTNTILDALNQAYSELVATYKKYYDCIMENVLDQQFFNCKKISINPHRGIDNSLQKILVTQFQQDIQISKENTKNIFQLQKEHHFSFEKLQVLCFFPHKKLLYDIIIMNEISQSVIFVLINFKGQIQLRQKIEGFENPIFVYHKQEQTLTGFNWRSQSFRFEFDDVGKIISEKVYFNLQADSITSAAYLDFDQSFMLLTVKKQIKKWQVKGSDQLMSVKELIQDPDTNAPKEIPFKPSDGSLHYDEVQSTSSGNYFFLISNGAVDIFNINNSRVKCIKISETFKHRIKIFEDSKDVFVVQITKSLVKVLTNLSNQTELVENEKQVEQTINGNFILDIAKGASVKFGDNNLFLQTYIDKICYLYAKPEPFNIMKDYFDALDFSGQASLLALEKPINTLALERDTSPIFTVIGTRVPIQLCTIENGQLIPLIDGFRSNFAQNQLVSVSEKSKLLSFSYLDHHLLNIKGPIYVVSIIGRQSSGKSYLLNRLFGTKFAVAASRCTDGIWASIARVEDTHFLVFDCEGLFSARRSVSDETQLMSFLAGLCDITILNQDLTFNRYLNTLFDNLTNAIGILRGESLFKGQLLVAVRDISSSDNKGGEQELLRNMEELKTKNKKQSSFLTSLFNDKFLVQLFHNFEQEKLFNDELKQLRSRFLKMARETKHWTNASELLDKMKILLVQLEMQDDENSEKVYLQLQLEKEMENSMNSWTKYLDDHFIEYKGIKFYQSRFELTKDDSKVANCFEQVVQELKADLKCKNEVSQHNENQSEIQSILQTIINQRSEMILAKSFLNFTKSTVNQQLQQIINHQKNTLKQFLDLQKEQYKFCEDSCSSCFLKCSLMRSHNQKNREDREKLYEQLNNVQKRLSKKDTNDQEIKKSLIDRDSLIQQLEEIKRNLSLKDKELERLTIDFELRQIDLQCSDIKQQLKIFKLIKIKEDDKIDHAQLKHELQLLIDEFNQEFDSDDALEIIWNSKQRIEARLEDIPDFLNLLNYNIQRFPRVNDEITKKKQECSILLDQIISELQKNDLKEIEQVLNKDLEELNRGRDLVQQTKQQSDALQQQIQIQQQQLENELIQFKQQKDGDKIILQADIIKQIRMEIQYQLSNILNKSKQLEEDQEKIYQPFKEKSQLLRQLEQKTVIKRLLRNMRQKEKRQVHLRKIQSQSTIKNLIQKTKQHEKQQAGLEEHVHQDVEQAIIQMSDLQEQIDQLGKQSQEFQEEFEKKEAILNNLQLQLDNYLDLINQRESIETQLVCLQEKQNLLEDKISKLQKSHSEIVMENTQRQTMQQKTSQEISRLEAQSQDVERRLNLFLNYKSEIDEFLIVEKKLEEMKANMIQHQQYLLKFPEEIRQEIPIEKIPERIQLLNEQIQKERQLEIETQKKISDLTNLSADFSDKIKLETEIKRLDQLIKEEHNCGRGTHQCDQKCFVCKNEKSCKLQAGHADGDHLCEMLEHKCIHPCGQNECKNSCRFLIKHDGPHKCDQKHDCKERCKFCTQFCQFERSEEHQIHTCKTQTCLRKCYLCNRKCRHEHEHSINDDPTKHLCEDTHKCVEDCSLKGICKIDYREEPKIWKTEISEFTYTNFAQVADRQKCHLLIPVGKLKHDGNHECQTEKHRCTERCPECEGFCTREFAHGGLHTTHTHRNKDNQIFTMKVGPGETKVDTIKLGSEREYKVGESSSPETCTLSCTRRGRAHFHLVSCGGGDTCLEKLLSKQKARHSKSKYLGFGDQMFDEVLCVHFWSCQNWQNPSPNLDIISSCNAYCGRCKGKEKTFCTKPAWHTESIHPNNHEFKCNDSHDTFESLCVAFVIDTTGSMSSYIEMCMEVIQNIMKQTLNLLKNPNKLKFAVVSYKDHCDKLLVEKSDFGDHEQATKFLNTLQADGGGDGPEAVFDGLNTAVNLSWLANSDKVVFLICDAPAHGKQYNGGMRDDHPEGCPCNLNGSTILREMKSKKIDFKILALNSSLNMMITLFKEDYPELEVLTAENVKEYGEKIVNNVIEMLETDELTFRK